ncbi:MAG: type I methionyl aminopeptidase, partial [Bacteroidota bacterium]
SVNHQVIHGLPSSYVLKEGDIVSIDCGVLYGGYHSDAAYTYALGNVNEKTLHLLLITKEALYQGIKNASVNDRIGGISNAIFTYVNKNGYTVVKEYGGHGIGKNLHEAPYVPNFGKKEKGVKIEEGMVLAVEPMVNFGKSDIIDEEDGWTVSTLDNKPSAHFEHTIAIINGKPEILTTYKYIEQALQQYV